MNRRGDGDDDDDVEGSVQGESREEEEPLLWFVAKLLFFVRLVKALQLHTDSEKVQFFFRVCFFPIKKKHCRRMLCSDHTGCYPYCNRGWIGEREREFCPSYDSIKAQTRMTTQVPARFKIGHMGSSIYENATGSPSHGSRWKWSGRFFRFRLSPLFLPPLPWLPNLAVLVRSQSGQRGCFFFFSLWVNCSEFT